jgi:hypothetical protein
MEYPNRKHLVLAFVAVATCSVWLAVDVDTGSKAPNDSKLLAQEAPRPRAVTLNPQLPKPAHQSVAIESRSRTAPVLGD